MVGGRRLWWLRVAAVAAAVPAVAAASLFASFESRHHIRILHVEAAGGTRGDGGARGGARGRGPADRWWNQGQRRWQRVFRRGPEARAATAAQAAGGSGGISAGILPQRRAAPVVDARNDGRDERSRRPEKRVQGGTSPTNDGKPGDAKNLCALIDKHSRSARQVEQLRPERRERKHRNGRSRLDEDDAVATAPVSGPARFEGGGFSNDSKRGASCSGLRACAQV